MISVFIFLAHIVFFIYIVVNKWRTDSMSAGLTNAALIIILFAVGWSIIAMVTQLVIDPKGFGEYFDRDTLNLTLLAIIEFFFYKYYYFTEEKPEATANGKEK